jgi:hypothetical protein
MAADNSRQEAGSEWRAIAQKSGTREFAVAFTANPVLETSVLNGPLVGTAAVEAFFIATAHGMYDSLRFTTETNDGQKTYLEWEGRVFGKDVGSADRRGRGRSAVNLAAPFLLGAREIPG